MPELTNTLFLKIHAGNLPSQKLILSKMPRKLLFKSFHTNSNLNKFKFLSRAKKKLSLVILSLYKFLIDLNLIVIVCVFVTIVYVLYVFRICPVTHLVLGPKWKLVVSVIIRSGHDRRS